MLRRPRRDRDHSAGTEAPGGCATSWLLKGWLAGSRVENVGSTILRHCARSHRSPRRGAGARSPTTTAFPAIPPDSPLPAKRLPVSLGPLLSGAHYSAKSVRKFPRRARRSSLGNQVVRRGGLCARPCAILAGSSARSFPPTSATWSRCCSARSPGGRRALSPTGSPPPCGCYLVGTSSTLGAPACRIAAKRRSTIPEKPGPPISNTAASSATLRPKAGRQWRAATGSTRRCWNSTRRSPSNSKWPRNGPKFLARRAIPTRRIVVYAAITDVHPVHDAVPYRRAALDNPPAHASLVDWQRRRASITSPSPS
jgi:hypothetical protein